jgi:3-phenylpropionate/trans-cinnamate dioxygenase ferredoxin reductase component
VQRPRHRAMRHFKYLIIGGGMTADAAVKGIRQVDPDGTAAVIGDEPDPPYKRPPLTKALWKGKSIDTIWCKTEIPGVELVLNRRAVSVDPATKEVLDDSGQVYTYDKLLLATGGTPRRLLQDGQQILYYRTLQDYRRLAELTRIHHHFSIIGGGFVGSELAAALAMNGKQVRIIFPEAALGARLFPPDLAQHLSEYYRARGVDVVSGRAVADVQTVNGRCMVRLEDGQTLATDAVVAGVGIDLNTGLAADAGLSLDNGIVVNEFLEASPPDIYAAGDVANFHNPLLGKRLRVEHEDNARMMGRAAGQCMAGARAPYHYLPCFYSDLFDLGYEAIGETHPRHVTAAVWQEPYRKGVIFYLDQGRVRGVIFWNVWNAVPAGRELLAQPGPFDQARLNAWVAQLPQA